MRVAGILALVLFLPAFSCAAELININTADAELLDTLPGIGPSKAAAIIDYRTEHGPFVRIEDIQNVSGIGPSTYADIEPLITVGDEDAPDPLPDPLPADDPADTASTTPTVASPDGGPPEYMPIPTLRISTSGNRTVSSGADIAFAASVYDGKGNKRDDATVSWSFGDGMRRAGTSVYHRYYEPGEYLTVVRAATSDGGDAYAESVITVKNAGIRIVSVSVRGITLANSDSRTLDLSLWRLSMGGKEFKIPADTQILAGRTILFPSQIIELPISDSAMLLYPSGEAAAAYPASAPASAVQQIAVAPASSGQPSVDAASYKKVQGVEPLAVNKVEPIINTTTNVQVHAQAVNAPAAATELAAAGAASPAPGLFKSPWILGLLGIVVTAAGAFILI